MDNTVWITAAEASYLLGVADPQTPRNLAKNGRLRFRREYGSRRYLFALDSVLQLAEHRRAHPETRGRKVPLRDLVSAARSGGLRVVDAAIEQRSAASPSARRRFNRERPMPLIHRGHDADVDVPSHIPSMLRPAQALFLEQLHDAARTATREVDPNDPLPPPGGDVSPEEFWRRRDNGSV